ncbi:MAG: hypothetical protein J4432_04195 [DPANN group archaeon]|nr:hypothetical protein [DPANN group archaeon]
MAATSTMKPSRSKATPHSKAKPSGTSRAMGTQFTYDYLLVEYLKEISNEITYISLITSSIFILLLLDIFQPAGIESFDLIRLIFIVFIVGGFFLYALSSWTKRRIEASFRAIL